MGTRTITLTGRPPVSVTEENWPVIASAGDSEHDGQVECQANVRTKWTLAVRQHEDGRAIVYARYTRTSNYQHARDYSAAGGDLLPAKSSAADICAAIGRVGAAIAEAEHHDRDAARWPTLVAACIADMPAEELA